jgi:membrane associated rhomboid family serine protease
MTQYKLWQVALFYLLIIALLAYVGFNLTKFGINLGSSVGKDLGAALGAIVGVLVSLALYRFVRRKGLIQDM